MAGRMLKIGDERGKDYCGSGGGRPVQDEPIRLPGD